MSRWEDGYARDHQSWLTWKNKQTCGNFIPTIKVLKHLRSHWDLDPASFHIECLLFNLPDALYAGGPADYIHAVLAHLAGTTADAWYRQSVPTPCGERDILVASEWGLVSWRRFHEMMGTWANCSRLASVAQHKSHAVGAWQLLLGKDYFPEEVGA
jgi:hypothetical protein